MSRDRDIRAQKLHREIPKASANSGRIWRVWRTIIFWVFLVIFVLQIGTAVLLKAKPELLVKKMPVSLLEITSDSMYPKFKAGDGVLENHADFDSLKKGDIITFYQSGELVTHEIISVNKDGTVTTEGLANGIPDIPVSEDKYSGKVILIIPNLSGFLSLSYGFWRKIIWILLIVVILFGSDIFSKIYDEVQKKKEGEQQP